VYGNSLRGEFIWDDFGYVRDNAHIKNWSYLPDVFLESVGAGAQAYSSFYRPLQMVSYMADYSIWKLDVFGYHCTNLFLHVLAGVGVYWLLSLLFQRSTFALLTAVVYTIHPVHTEAVASIAGRADSLALFFLLLSFIMYIKAEKTPSSRGYIAVSLLGYVLALLSKESTIVLPVLLLLYHRIFRRRFFWKAGAGIFLITGAYVLWRILFLRGFVSDARSAADTFSRIPGFFAAFGAYIRILFLPLDLHVEYGDRIFAMSDPAVLAGVFLAGVLLLYVFRYRRDPLTVFAAGWFLITFLPVTNIYRINNSFMKEHWLYVPSIGFFMILSDRMASLYRNRRLRALSLCMLFVMGISYGFLTVRQNEYWGNFINFCRRSLSYTPESAGMHNNLGNAYVIAGRYPEAIREYRKALLLDPRLVGAYFNLGAAYRNVGDYAAAESAYLKVLDRDPANMAVYVELIKIARVQGDQKKAARLLSGARSINAERVRLYYDAGNRYYDRGEYSRAVVAYKQALEINPASKEIYNNLANAYVCLGRTEEAAAWCTKALELDPSLPEAHNNLAVIYYYARKYNQAIEHIDKALALGYPVKSDFLDTLKPYRK
jgi:tetratricopeptide (TPR) repeat protein